MVWKNSYVLASVWLDVQASFLNWTMENKENTKIENMDFNDMMNIIIFERILYCKNLNRLTLSIPFAFCVTRKFVFIVGCLHRLFSVGKYQIKIEKTKQDEKIPHVYFYKVENLRSRICSKTQINVIGNRAF